MKTLISILFVSIIVSACGSAETAVKSTACASSPVVGTWVNDSTDQYLVLGEDCIGHETSCASSFNYEKDFEASGTTTITVTATNGGAGCLPLGTLTCTYTYPTVHMLNIDCGGGIVTYLK